MEKIAVLMPNYNNAPYLKEALDSLFAQTYQNFIIYFVDDCSTDNSVEIAESYTDDRLVIIKKEQNSGIVDTMNIGLDKIDTTYFIRMDGDDISTPQRFEKLVKFMNENPSVGACSSSIRTFGLDNRLMTYGKDAEMNKAALIFGHALGHASSIFRTAVFKKHQIKYVDRFWRMEDYYLFYSLKDICLTSSIPDELYLYRQGEYNNNQELANRKKEEFKRFYAMIFDEMGYNFGPEQLEMHVQLNKRGKPTFSFSAFNTHIQGLIEANKSLSVFPSRELTLVLTENLHKIAFALVDDKKMSWKEIRKENKTINGLLSYAIKTRLRSFFGKKSRIN